MKYQRKSNPILACEGTDVFCIGWEREISIQMPVTDFDGSH